MNDVFDFATFRMMLTPILIQIMFWIGMMGCLLYGLVLVITGADSRGKDKHMIGIGILIAITGPMVLRIVCETSIILFKIHDELKAANDQRS